MRTHPSPLRAGVRSVLALAFALAPATAHAQLEPPRAPDAAASVAEEPAGWLYASVGVVGTPRLADASSAGAGPMLNIVGSPRGVLDMLPEHVGFRFEFHDVLYGLANYTSADPRFTNKEIASGVRTHAFGLQVMRPTRAVLRPYAAAMIGQVKLTLDADEEKLARRDGVGGVFRLGSYVALLRGAHPPVLDLSAAFHLNGARRHWREGEVTLQRGSLNFVSVTAAIGLSGLLRPPG
jgi:hypothetical protein